MAISRLWDHIKRHELQDPADKQSILADEVLRLIFGKEHATMFELAGLIGPHLTAA